MSPCNDTWDVCFPTDKKYLHHIIHALFCTDEMTLNILVPHTPLPYINIGSIMDVYSLLYTLYVIPPAILTLVIKLPNTRLAALTSSFAFLLNVHPSRHQDIYTIHNNLEYFQSIEK
jgi:hypothetical protein